MLGGGVDEEGGGVDSLLGAGELEGAGDEPPLLVEPPEPSCIHQPPLSLIQW